MVTGANGRQNAEQAHGQPKIGWGVGRKPTPGSSLGLAEAAYIKTKNDEFGGHQLGVNWCMALNVLCTRYVSPTAGPSRGLDLGHWNRGPDKQVSVTPRSGLGKSQKSNPTSTLQFSPTALPSGRLRVPGVP
jgi:hypothetical protein